MASYDSRGGRTDSGSDRGGSSRDSRGGKGSDKGGRSESKGGRSESRGGNFGSLGDHKSYGMDKGSFDKSIGSGRDRGGRSEGSGRAKAAPKTEEKGFFGRAVESIGDFFGGKEDTGGFSPMGGPASYGMTNKQFDETVGKRRYESMGLGSRLAREVDYFQEAPMDYVSDLLDNPLVSGAALMTGMGATAFGVKAIDAAMDVFQGEEDALGALGNIGAAGLSFTSLGSALPSPVRAIAKGTLKEGTQGFAKATAGTLGGKIGGMTSSALASAVTDNPYARAALTAAGTASGAYGATQGLKVAQAQPKTGKPSVGMDQPEYGDSESKSSPLVSTGKQAVKASKKLMQPADVGLYANTVKQLPFYGLGANNQLPYYGV